MEEIVANVSIEGARPLLMNAIFTEELGGASKKGQVFDPEEEAKKKLYLDQDGNVSQPAEHIEGCLVNAGSDFKFKGQKTYKKILQAGVIVTPRLIPHNNQNWVIDTRSVVVQRNRIARHRPRLDQWSLDFQIEISDDRIQPRIVEEILIAAGKYVGIADFRPKYGLFRVNKFEIQE